MTRIPIHDPADPRLDDYRDVRDRDLRGSAGQPGLFVGEQALVVEKMLARPGLTKSVLAAEAMCDRIAPLVPAGVPLYVAPQEVMDAVVGFPIHRGVLAVGYRPREGDLTLEAVVPARPGPLTVLVCEDITHIDNVGLLFRNAAAFGVDAVVLSPRCHDPLYRRCLRTSIGHVLTVPWARSRDWPDDLDRLRWQWGLTVVGAATDAGARPLDELEPPERVALLVGTEGEGLSAGALARCDARVRIPMAPGVDSLNAAVAAAVCLHRLSRAARA
jgi:tRNA G18 (ribose-2'-O)-methylase SpoU